MNKVYRFERITFGIQGLDAEALPLLQALLGEAQLRTNRDKQSNEVRVTFDLTEAIDYDGLYNFIKDAGVPPEKYGVRVSLVTDAYEGRVQVPDRIVNFLRKAGGQVGFSFIAVGRTQDDTG